MADITVAANALGYSADSVTSTATAGANITAGKAVYLDSSSTIQLADSNASALTAAAVGIAVNTALTGQTVRYLSSGTLTLGGTQTAGTPLFLATTAGAIQDVAPGSGEWVTFLGVVINATQGKMGLLVSGAQVS